jgi:superfamily I DNA and/or RNA helicase/very-short-patch-repair endonuclease
MPAISKSFLEILKKKLSFGSTRSILLNCIPGRAASRLGLNDLDLVKQGLSLEFINKLTSAHDFDFKFSIKFDVAKKDDSTEIQQEKEKQNSKKQKLERRLTNIKYDHDDILKEQGVETFGLGFPLLVRRNPNDITKVIVSPIFIWHLDIKQSFDQSRGWNISRKADRGIMVNESLRAYLKADQQVDLPKLPESMLEDGLLEKHELESFINDLKLKLNITLPDVFSWEIEEIPEKVVADEEAIGGSRIIFSGVFGIYKNQKQSLINDVEHILLNSENNNDELISSWENKTTPIEVDPSQHSVLRSLSRNNKIVIQGPPGTGKSQTLTAIITAALSDRKKVLVVCEKRTALEVLYQNIIKKYPYLERVIALLEDVTSDRSILVKNVRERENTPDLFKCETRVLEDLKLSTEFYEKIIADADEKYSGLRKYILDNKRWIDLVADWIRLKVSNDEIAELAWLSVQIEFLDSFDSIAPISIQIQDLQRKYLSCKDVLLEFDSLFNPNFDFSKADDINLELKSLTYELSNAIKNLEDQVITYTKTVESNTSIKINEILSICDDYTDKYELLKNRFNNPHSISFFDKFRLLFTSNRSEILEDISTLSILSEKISSFIREYIIEDLNQDEIKDRRIDVYLKSSRDILSDKIKNKLNSKDSIKLDKSYSEIFDNIHSQLSKTSGKINEIFNNAALNIESDDIRDQLLKWKKYRDNISEISAREEKIENYFEWKKAIHKTEAAVNNLVQAFISKGYESWIDTFNKAFLYRILARESRQNDFIKTSGHLTDIENTRTSIIPKQEAVLRHNIVQWFSQGINKIEKTGLSLKKLYNLRGSSGETKNSLRKIVNYNVSAFTDIHPLVLANPITVSTIFPTDSNLFDLVIFDEASQLRIEDTFSSLYRGKSVIVSGDSQQMPPSSYFESSRNSLDSNEETDEVDSEDKMLEEAEMEMASKESLLEWAIDEGYTQTYLDMHYRSRHPDLIEFSNVAFYNSRLIPMPGQLKDKPIEFTYVNGLYENRSNQEEANKIIDILRNTVSVEKSVGVATFNLNQRNLILDLIGKTRYEDKDFNDKMIEFEANGFFVKNLENIQGDERDIIIISTTFGSRSNGSFSMMFGPIGQKNGHRLLNVIITRAKEKVFLLTSIPENRLHEYREYIQKDNKVSGKSGLLAYILYCKYVSLGDQNAKNELLSDLRNLIQANSIRASKNLGLTESPFEEEVYQMLVSEFGDTNVIPQYQCGGFRIDLVVISPNKHQKIAIECDGAAYHSSELNWHHDIYRQRQLEKEGFIFQRIWSTNWWKNHQSEWNKLVKFINQN